MEGKNSEQETLDSPLTEIFLSNQLRKWHKASCLEFTSFLTSVSFSCWGHPKMQHCSQTKQSYERFAWNGENQHFSNEQIKVRGWDVCVSHWKLNQYSNRWDFFHSGQVFIYHQSFESHCKINRAFYFSHMSTLPSNKERFGLLTVRLQIDISIQLLHWTVILFT